MISINFTLFVQIAQFLILVWILNRILVQPILRNLEAKEQEIGERKSVINGLIEQAQARQEDYQARLKEAHQTASAERETMMVDARAEAGRLKEESNEEARQVIERVRREISASKDEARQALAAQEDSMAEQLTEMVMGRGAA